METDNLFVENNVDQFFSERSAIRLTSNESGTVLNETTGSKDTFSSAQLLDLEQLIVPNTIEVGLRAGLGDFDVDAITVLGSLDTADEVDLYSVEAEAGDLFNFEVISEAPNRITNSFDSQLTIFDEDGNIVNYFGQPAFNDDEFESFDSIIVDLVLPETGTYFAQVNGFDATDTGDYELFFHRFNGVAVPEPSSFVLGLLVLAATTAKRRRS